MEIPLHNRSGVVIGHALIDDEDFDLVRGYVWALNRGGYVTTTIPHPDGGSVLDRNGRPHGRRTTKIYMHRLILGLERGDPTQTDHWNRIRHDNRRVNLRLATHRSNRQNVTSYKGSSSRYRGVSWDAQHKKWAAYVTLDRKMYHLGLFTGEKEAASVASAWRTEHMEFSVEART